MAVGSYGTNRPADVNPDDVDIFYTFTKSREFSGQPEINRLDANSVLIPYKYGPETNEVNGVGVVPTNVAPVDGVEIFPGLYTLVLPATTFNQIGFYSIVIKPKEIRTEIRDCGVLSSLPGVKGIVINTDAPELSNFTGKLGNGGLVGYRIEYIRNNQRVRNVFRIVTSSNRAEVVSANLNNSSSVSTRYSFSPSGSLLYLTLTPSTGASIKPNDRPFIGEVGQKIIISNTFFNPITLEVEVTEHDLETLSHGIYGNQTKSFEDGIYTIYDGSNNIYKQYNLFELRNDFGDFLFEVREERSIIDDDKEFDTIVNS